jgi:hypothetical protein
MAFDTQTKVEKHLHKCASDLLNLNAVHSLGVTTLGDRPAALIALRRFGMFDRFRARRILRGCPADFVVVGSSMSLGQTRYSRS